LPSSFLFAQMANHRCFLLEITIAEFTLKF